jgi:putative tryptophan/tyrosine transport system substrate-binding protein
MRRREFIGVLGGLVLTSLPRQGAAVDKSPRVGFLDAQAETDSAVQAGDAAFSERLSELGWIAGRNVQIEHRWAAGSIDRLRLLAKELVQLKPDVLVAITTPATAALRSETQTIPIVFAQVSDPVGSGFVASLAHPGGNITGFINIEASLSGKWLAPQVSRVGFLFNPQTAPYARYYLDAFRTAASALAIEAIEASFLNSTDLENVIGNLGREGGTGLIVMPDTSTGMHIRTIISLADRFRLPTIFAFSLGATLGGLMAYGIEFTEMLRGAAAYVDRILRGAKPDELPVQLPTKFELTVNLKTARTLGLAVSPHLLAIADKVIE